MDIGLYCKSRDAFYEDLFKKAEEELDEVSKNICKVQTSLDELSKEEDKLKNQLYALYKEEKDLYPVVAYLKNTLYKDK